MTRQELAHVRGSLPQDFNALLRAALEKERTAVRQEFEAALRNDRQLLQNDLASRLHVEKEISAARQEFESALQNDQLVLRQESESKLTGLRESLRKSLLMLKSNRPGEDTPPVRVPDSAADVSCDELGPAYLAFENLFRGPRDEIKERVSEYLPLITGKRIGSPQMPVLDLGCGRGEWLEVLVDHGLTALGVDSNQTQADEGRVRGLDVRVADALSFLAELPEQSQGAITAFHLVEHMPFRAILDLLDEAVRVLKPGGLLILETPNPANLIVGATTFYLDPTHIRPIPAEMLRFFVEAHGFCNAEIRPLHPFPDCFRLAGEVNSAASVLNDLVYGPRDYAIVAERP
jgi:SAM-dependent methyltransferase